MIDKEREAIQKALDIAIRYGGCDGDHHKAWVIDQMVRALTKCPLVEREAVGAFGVPYQYTCQGESPEYIELVRNACDGEDGPDTYSWSIGRAP